jgi:hypothetical protein
MRTEDYLADRKRTKALGYLCWILALNAVVSITELILKYWR